MLNDGPYGAEVHKLRSHGVSEAESVFGRPDFAAIASGFGIDGVRVDPDRPDVSVALDRFASRRGPLADQGFVGMLDDLVRRRHPSHDRPPRVVDVHISRTVPSIRYRRS